MKEEVVRAAVASGQHPPRPLLLNNNALWAIVKRCCSFRTRDRGDAEHLWQDMNRVVPDPIQADFGRTTRRRRDGLAAYE